MGTPIKTSPSMRRAQKRITELNQLLMVKNAQVRVLKRAISHTIPVAYGFGSLQDMAADFSKADEQRIRGKVTKAAVIQVKELLKAGKSNEEASAIVGLSRATIVNIKRRLHMTREYHRKGGKTKRVSYAKS